MPPREGAFFATSRSALLLAASQKEPSKTRGETDIVEVRDNANVMRNLSTDFFHACAPYTYKENRPMGGRVTCGQKGCTRLPQDGKPPSVRSVPFECGLQNADCGIRHRRSQNRKSEIRNPKSPVSPAGDGRTFRFRNSACRLTSAKASKIERGEYANLGIQEATTFIATTDGSFIQDYAHGFPPLTPSQGCGLLTGAGGRSRNSLI